MKKRRNPLEKETFLEGNRQKWCAIFTAIGLSVMAMVAYGGLKDPTPFLTYFTGIGVTFILGASGNAILQSYKATSTNSNETSESVETTNSNVDETIKNIYVCEKLDPKDVDDPTLD